MAFNKPWIQLKNDPPIGRIEIEIADEKKSKLKMNEGK